MKCQLGHPFFSGLQIRVPQQKESKNHGETFETSQFCFFPELDFDSEPEAQ